MDVSVRFKPGHRWLRSPKTPSVLGGGLLERVRSTTLALLGLTTAVGLAMVALALNQSWPLIADSPLPVTPPRHQAVGEATVAARGVVEPSGSSPVRVDGAPRGEAPGAGGGNGGGARAPQDASAPSTSAELVVAPSTPAEPQGDAPRVADKPTPPPSPGGTSPEAPATPVAVTEPTQPESAPQMPPPVEASPPASSAEAAVDSSDDDWDDDDDWGDDDGDWDDDHDWHDHGHGRHWSGRHNDD